MQSEQDLVNQELNNLKHKYVEPNYVNGIDLNKLTRQQKRKVFKNDKFSNKIKQLLK
jgi:hypothetical protein